MGPILPYLSVYGKQLGISPLVMGSVTGILPVLYLLSKPVFGFLVDYFRNQRKLIFICLLIMGSLSLVLLYFLPSPAGEFHKYLNKTIDITYSKCNIEPCLNQTRGKNYQNRAISYHADLTCLNKCQQEKILNVSTVLVSEASELLPICIDNVDFNNTCHNNHTAVECNVTCLINDIDIVEEYLYYSARFWGFVILMALGCICFNVANSISEGSSMGYGRQRVWGSIGWGITALLAGYAIDLVSEDEYYKSYTPAFILVIVFTGFDIISCTKLQLPIMSRSDNIAKDVWKLLKLPKIYIFLIFATIAGIIDSFLIYFLFWYIEDLAKQTDFLSQIKLIEGLVVAAQTLGGEVLVFSLSGKILKKFGYGYTMTFCFVCYSIRLLLISLSPNPWWIVLIELFMQGPSYALCYTIIVGFASVVAPPGTSATVQGIVAGMDDGFGFALGSFIGGILYKMIGGAMTLRLFSLLSILTAISYLILYVTILKDGMPKTKNESSRDNIKWKSPQDAAEDCDTSDINSYKNLGDMIASCLEVFETTSQCINGTAVAFHLDPEVHFRLCWMWHCITTKFHVGIVCNNTPESIS
ncbi:Similar to Mfsd6: Major facilitator superfamily domain-containing protein 6 (Mus musculus) [Cotesia congregata]|uniref:Similar to Mfsd6: Major facilitator superfamily domain-containing protein 6 (Mus musculus) n=1 Tax=Cotesia congregata TaxID=51543 RepID=A0A8J2EC31_COTCN|nr:Similar to Mfsd6: Major facilitator superfamily domain-containing protein 6 (Mus musculus) [Cotesia congregata]